MVVLSVLLLATLVIHCLCYLSHIFFLLALSFSEVTHEGLESITFILLILVCGAFFEQYETV